MTAMRDMPEALTCYLPFSNQHIARRRPAFCNRHSRRPLGCDRVPKVGNGRASQGIGVHMVRVLQRAARVAYAFVVMNYAAVAGLISLVRRDPLWR